MLREVIRCNHAYIQPFIKEFILKKKFINNQSSANVLLMYSIIENLKNISKYICLKNELP